MDRGLGRTGQMEMDDQDRLTAQPPEGHMNVGDRGPRPAAHWELVRNAASWAPAQTRGGRI